jgi:hypothetical protein
MMLVPTVITVMFLADLQPSLIQKRVDLVVAQTTTESGVLGRSEKISAPSAQLVYGRNGVYASSSNLENSSRH